MCGFFSAYDPEMPSGFDYRQISTRVSKALLRRGPDFQAYSLFNNKKIFFLHTRLSIQDLSSESNQPISHPRSKNSSLIYNGEIYNNFELVSSFSLDSDPFVNIYSDTTILSSLLHNYNPKSFLGNLDGMISFCYYDSKHDKIYFYRDHTAQKPLFYKYDSSVASNKKIQISSSISAFRAFSPSEPIEHDQYQLSLFLQTQYYSPDKSIYKNIFSAKPGYLYTYDCSNSTLSCQYIEEKMVAVSPHYQSGELFQEYLSKALVGSRDLGILLSGGIDSSLITALLAPNSPISCAYTLQSPSSESSNEFTNSIKLAKTLNIRHEIIPYDNDTALDIAINIAEIVDHPNCDPSIIPSTVVGLYAKSKSTILLTGDGGDEFFGGYTRYQYFIRRFGRLYPFLPTSLKELVLYYYLSSFGQYFGRIKSFVKLVKDNFFNKLDLCVSGSLLLDISTVDSLLYMRQHTLPKIDRALMYSSIEGRAPFLLKSSRHIGKKYLESHPFTYNKPYLRKLLNSQYPDYIYSDVKRGFTADLPSLYSSPAFCHLMSTACSLAVDLVDSDMRPNIVRTCKSLSSSDPSPSALRRAWQLHTVVSCYQYHNAS